MADLALPPMHFSFRIRSPHESLAIHAQIVPYNIPASAKAKWDPQRSFYSALCPIYLVVLAIRCSRKAPITNRLNPQDGDMGGGF